MLRDHSHTDKRSAFTLVEMVVVLLIIAILASLVTSAVVMGMGKIPEVQTRTEIAELDAALRAFMSDYGLSDPPPSKLFLNETNPLSTPSAAFLQKVFGKNLGPTDWNGDSNIAPPNVTWILEGEQCLVFYLGGIPVGGNPQNLQGFSTNNMNPAQLGGKRKGPYYNFQTARLVSMASVNSLSVPPNGPLSPYHPVYLDPWQVKLTVNGGFGPRPYVYFSTSGINNGYTYSQGTIPPGYSDCMYVWSTWVAGGWPNPTSAVPYMTTSGTYTYSNTYQIISAGKDGVFGFNPTATTPSPGMPEVPNNTWIPASGAIGPGADDQANFSSTLLGVGQN